jgi:DNA-binding MarR family transcriptional regulator
MNTRRSVSAGRVERLDGLLEAMRSFWAAASALRGRETRQQDSLSMAQVRLAAALYRDGPLTGARLAEAVQCSAGVASETLDQLERAGIVSRERSQSDRRAYTATLTEAGRQVVEQKIASLREQAAAALADCSDRELAAAAKVFSRLTEMLDRAPRLLAPRGDGT